MQRDLPAGAQRVQQFLISHGSEAQVQLLPATTATAEDAARALSVPVSHIGKSIVFGSEKGIVVVVVCGDQRVNAASLAELLEVADLNSMRADDVKRETGFSIGGVSPFALPEGIRIVVDERLYALPQCYVAAGHPRAVVSVKPTDLVDFTKASVLPCCEFRQSQG